jgi:hypothetical protein
MYQCQSIVRSYGPRERRIYELTLTEEEAGGTRALNLDSQSDPSTPADGQSWSRTTRLAGGP